MRIRLRPPEAPAPPVPPLDSRARDCAWDRAENKWRVFSDDMGGFLCFATPEQVKATFPHTYHNTVGAWAFNPPAAAMTATDREAYGRTGSRPTLHPHAHLRPIYKHG